MVITKRNTQSGMTLIEMMLVVAIMAILTTGGMTSWQSYQQRIFLEQASSGALAFMSQVQFAADWRNRSYRIRIGRRENVACISAGQLADSSDCHSELGLAFTLPDPGLSLDMSQSDIGLGFYGLRNSAGTGHLTVVNRAGRVRLIVSAKGRLRRCSEKVDGRQPYLPGIAPC
ncbi:prepilin-type N-terminal cleavage/methylation domain-containing protein [Budvicia diplopodorum]|uniref:prepilin-type N-terminal cleavage/methylation domain-containing protein n=1 Tax=Budvicia diplopodorum TaxID=1119056 RepID=UPI00248363AE|nr:prepilin-type N-terminal cleavage/methylation domain-containing protein [Budvicia diplopodorum]